VVTDSHLFQDINSSLYAKFKKPPKLNYNLATEFVVKAVDTYD